MCSIDGLSQEICSSDALLAHCFKTGTQFVDRGRCNELPRRSLVLRSGGVPCHPLRGLQSIGSHSSLCRSSSSSRATLLRQSWRWCAHNRVLLRTRLCGVVLLAPWLCDARDRYVRSTWPWLRREPSAPATQGSAEGRRPRHRASGARRSSARQWPRLYAVSASIVDRTMGAWTRNGTNMPISCRSFSIPPPPT